MQVVILGAGNIGKLIACLLANSGGYQVSLADAQIQDIDKQFCGSASQNIVLETVDASNAKALLAYFKKTKPCAVISALPFFCNPLVAEQAKAVSAHYFDLTEDTKVTEAIAQLSKGGKQAFVPQCGLAPGLVSIVANDLMRQFETVDSVSLRVGALPIHPNTVLKYALTWSTDGLINEYGNPCYSIVNYERFALQPLEGLETIEIDGMTYEAFNTSGGLGSLAKSAVGKVRHLTYKTIRYPGHCEQMRFLLNDLRLNEDRETLKRILENAVPRTTDDVVIVYVLVTGVIDGQFMQKTFVKKIYPKTIANRRWAAIQVTTATTLCAVFDIVMNNPDRFQGEVRQEQFSLDEILSNRFGEHLNV